MKITVVITAYNIEKYIGACFQELLGQTFNDFNVLVVDDCSTDNTRSIIERYTNKFNGRLNVIFCEKNSGSPGKARNVALESKMIVGKYVVFLDGDDNIESNMLERLYSEAELQNADVVCCGYNRLNFSTRKEFSVEMNRFYVKNITKTQNIEYIPFINGSLWNKLIRVELIKNIRFSSIRIGEDACFLLEAYKDANKITFINDILIHYNVYEKSMISNIDVNEVYKLSEKLLQIYNECDEDRQRSSVILSAFIHVGISACVRVYQSRCDSIDEHIAWTKKYFEQNFPNWYKSECLRMSYLRKLGIKGYAIKVCTYLYRMNIFKTFLFMYTFVIRRFGIDFKW